jgi:hypothetical protein
VEQYNATLCTFPIDLTSGTGSITHHKTVSKFNNVLKTLRLNAKLKILN